MKNVLFVLTNHGELGETGQKTGFWIEEFASPYYHLIDNGVKVTLCSPKGGQAPIDPKSNEPDYQTPATLRFNEDETLQKALSLTKKLEDINATDFGAVFFPGGHGPLWDLADDPHVKLLIEAFYQQHKVVSAVCHAPVVLKNAETEPAMPLVQGKRVTSFTNSEETAAGLDQVVPYLVEDELVRNGAIFSSADDWQPHVVEDGLLITGQNPASSLLVAEYLLKKIETVGETIPSHV